MSGIAFLVPYEPDASNLKGILSPYPDVHVEFFQLHEHDQAIAKIVGQGYDIIVARAGTANRIRQSGLKLTLVELPIMHLDIIRAIEKANTLGDKVAVVAYPPMMHGLNSLLPYLNLSFQQYLVDSSDSDLEDTVLRAARNGANVIVGGGLICQAAEKNKLPAVYITTGREATLQALQEALRLKEAIDAEKVKGRLFAAILDYVHDGILTVDCDQKITSINLRAQQLLNAPPRLATGQSIGKFWPGLSLSELIRTRQEELNKLVQIKGQKLICNKVPILVDGKLNGALVTFQEIATIQRTEAHIRKEMYNKGHVAKKSFPDIAGQSASLLRTVTLAKEFAATSSNILIVGETGTGKEVFAQSIHNHSPRQAGPFVAVNCAALPAQILESELFGYVGGAFTGANKEGKPGLFELAHGGTIFLDEISEMDYTNQSRLLRVLQERAVMRLGSDRVIAIDVRVIAATNKGLKGLVRSHKFREDLFFRLNVLKLELPALRERPQDIQPLAERFLSQLAPHRQLTFDAAAWRALEAHSWPGNIRELQNTIERLMASCQTDTISAADIEGVLEKWDIGVIESAGDTSLTAASVSSPPPPAAPKASFFDEEIAAISAALYAAKGNLTEAAQALGINRSTLWRKMKRLGLQIKNGAVERV